jgi:hypothetical protein
MEDRTRIAFARDDIVEWFDWNRHRVVTSRELADELDLPEADVQTVFAKLVLDGKIDQHVSGYHRAVRLAAIEIWYPPALQALAIPPEGIGATAHAGSAERQEELA